MREGAGKSVAGVPLKTRGVVRVCVRVIANLFCMCISSLHAFVCKYGWCVHACVSRGGEGESATQDG